MAQGRGSGGKGDREEDKESGACERTGNNRPTLPEVPGLAWLPQSPRSQQETCLSCPALQHWHWQGTLTCSHTKRPWQDWVLDKQAHSSSGGTEVVDSLRFKAPGAWGTAVQAPLRLTCLPAL